MGKVDANLRGGPQNRQSRVAGFWHAPVRFLLGYDIFISYAWKDAAGYAELLETKLEAAGFAVFRDEREIDVGERLDGTLERAIRRSRQFVLLDTPGARQSTWVTSEITTRLRLKRKGLTRIKFQGPDIDVDWSGSEGQEFSQKVAGFRWVEDTQEALATGKPLDTVIEEISRNFRKLRLQNVMWLIVAIVVAILSGSLIWSIGKTIQARRQTRIAVSRQLASQAIAELWRSPQFSAKDALSALDLSETDEAKGALDQAVSQSNVTAVLEDPDDAPLSSAAFTRNGRFVVTSTYWDKIWLWDSTTGKPLQHFASDGILRVSTDSMTPDGRYILTALEDRNGFWVAIWDATTGTKLGGFVASKVGPITSAIFSPSGKYIATTGEDYTAAIWDATAILQEVPSSTDSNTRMVQPIAREKLHHDIINSIRFADNEEYVVTASQDGRAEIWQWKSHRKVELRRRTTALFSAEFHPRDIHIVLTAGQDGHVTLWHNALAAHMSLDLPAHEVDVRQASFDSTGAWIVTASSDGTAVVWNCADPHLNYTLTGHHGAVTAANFSPDGRSIVTGSVDHTARIWMAKPVPTLEEEQPKIQYLRNLILDK
jgi:WD40 repeat protein